MAEVANNSDDNKAPHYFTAAGSGKIQDRVKSDIEAITEQLIKEYKPLSLILTGSFAKGEGTVIELDGKLHYLSDCEMALVHSWPLSNERLNQTRQNFSDSLGIDFELFHNFPLKYRSGWLTNLLYNPGFVSISMYDRRYSSITLYGPDYIKTMPGYQPHDIPVWEGIRLIFIRMLGGLDAYYNFGNHNHGSDLSVYKTAYAIHRIIQACADALLIQAGEFHHSYSERAKLGAEILPRKYKPLLERIPPFFEQLEAALTAKLHPSQMIKDDLEKLWQSTQITADAVLRFLLQENYDIKFDSYDELPALYRRNKLLSSYFRPPGMVLQSIRNALNLPRLSTTHSRWHLNKWFKPFSHETLVSVPLLYFADKDPHLRAVFCQRLRNVFSIHVQNENDLRELTAWLKRIFTVLWV